jgi:hypothetical protein
MNSKNPAEKSPEVAQDKVVEANRQLLLQRSQVGLQKYGVSLSDSILRGSSSKYWLRHALEEALDLANYLQSELMRIEAEEAAEASARSKVACTHLNQKWNLFMNRGKCTNCGARLKWGGTRIEEDLDPVA